MTLAKAQPCLSRKENHDSRKNKKQKTRFFFSFSKGTGVTLTKAQLCLPRKKTMTFAKDKKETRFFLRKFFSPDFFIKKLRKTWENQNIEKNPFKKPKMCAEK